MKKYIVSLVFLISFFSFGQNYFVGLADQNFNYSSNSDINHIITREPGSDFFVHTLNINKLSFRDTSGATPYGYNGTIEQDVTSLGWTFSVVGSSSSVSYDPTTDQITVPYLECGEEVSVSLEITPAGGGSVNGGSTVTLRYEMACDFTLVQSYFNACDEEYIIKMNEITVQPSNSSSTFFPCRPNEGYALYLYYSEQNQAWDANPYQVDSGGNPLPFLEIDGVFNLQGLDAGNYFFYVENACGQTFPSDPTNQSSFPAQFTVSDGYNFGSEINFSGYQCYEDEISYVDITLTSVAYPLQEWYILDSNGNPIYNQNSDIENDSQISIVTGTIDLTSTFSVEDISFIIEGLPDGEYTFYFKDYIGCEETELFEIIRPGPLDAPVTLEHVTCPGGSDGKFSTVLSGGWSEPFDDNPFFPIDIDDPENSIWGMYTDLFLYNDTESEDYSSNLITYQSTDGQVAFTFNNLPAGEYTFSFNELVTTNANNTEIEYGCSKEINFEITEPDPLDIVADIINDAQCDEQASGSINTTSSGGTPFVDGALYNYSWTASSGGVVPEGLENEQNLTGLVAGTYTLTITDSEDCSYSESFDIDEPDPLTIVYDTKQDVSCFGGSDGSITVTVNGGTPFVDPNDSSIIDYDFTITKDGQNFTSFIETYNGSNSFTLSGLPSGTYTVVVTDQNGCEADQVIEVTIEEPPAITYTIDQTTLLDCYGDSDGEITITVSGGTPGYSVSLTGATEVSGDISSDGGSYTFSGLTAGTYSITVQDANFVSSPSGCDVTTESLIINEPEELIISNLSATEILCNADETSTITGTITGGTANYEVVLIGPGVNEVSSDNTGTINFTGLGAGTYTVQVSDANSATGGSGCYVEQSITIDEPDHLAISQNGSEVDVTCFGENTGSFQVSVSGGTPAYIFTATDSDSNSIGNPVQISTNVFEWSALYAGTYTVVVTDQNDCEADQVIEVTIEEPQEITYTIDQTTLLDCYGDSDGEITITVSGGTPEYSLSLTGTSTASGSISSDGGSYTFSGLTAGTYSITVQDANFVSSPSGCDVTTESLIINEPEELIISNLSATEILCNADETSTITGTITGGTANYEVVLIGPEVNEVSSDNTGTINFTDLGAGTYTVQVSDANFVSSPSGCYVEQSITIEEPDQLIISGVTSAYPDPDESPNFGVTAFGATDGTINITVEGGTLPYSFQWTVISGGPISGSTTSEDLFNLPAGVYSVLALDDNGCSVEMQFEITEPEPFLIFEDLPLHVDVDCYGTSSGELGVYVTGGTAPYDFEIANTTGDTPVVIDAVTNIDGNEYSITGLEAGEYTLSSEDANNVLISTQIIILQPDAPIDITETISDYNGYQISCFGAENGIISVVASGGGGTDNTTSYTYTWKRDENDYAPESPSTSDNLVGLSPGTYEVTVTDDVGCSYTETYILNQPDPLAISATLSNYSGFNISINGEDDGSIDLDVSGGVESYTYNWTTSNGTIPTGQESNQDLSNLVAGTYNVTITDQNNCTTSESFTLIEPDELTIEENLAAHTDVNCFGDSTGTLGISISGGIPPYTFVLENSEPIEIDRLVGQTNLFYSYTSGLSAGIYTVSVIDVSGATNQIEITILQPDAPIDITETISEFNGFNISCFGASDGTIDIVTTGGGGTSNSDQYTYEWTLGVDSFTVSSPSTPTNLQGLGPGIYEVTVTDDVGCTYTETYEITEPTGLTLSGVISNNNQYAGFGVSASGANDGFIDLTVGGGTTNYSYAWSTSDGVVPSGQETNQNLTGLVAGTYTVVITDSNDCTITEDYIVTEPEELLIVEITTSHVDVLCYEDSTGALEVAITGGATPYTYVLTGPVEETQPNTPNITYTKTGLPSGDYTVTATDANGTVVDIEITILQPAAPIDITETISEFNGFNISCFGASDGTIDIVTTGGGGTSNSDQYSYEWTLGVDSFTVSSPSTPTNLQGLGPGIYEVTVTDDVGCTYTETYEITEPTGLTLSGVISDYNGFGVSASGANDGSIAITVGGGTTNYSYAWSTSDGVVPSDQETNQNLTDLVAGTYTVVITDSNGCTITEDYVVTEPEELIIVEVTTSHVDVLCYDDSTGALEVAITGGATPYTYVLTGPVTETEGPTPNMTYIKTGLPTGDYTVTATDANGTVVDIEITILQPDAPIDITETISEFNGFNISCFGASDGTIDIFTTGGGGPSNSDQYTYEWTLGVDPFTVVSPSTPTNLQGLGPGIYEVTVTDDVGCTYTETYEITEPAGLTLSGVISDFNSFGVSCFGQNDGFITTTISGGTNNFDFNWTATDGGIVPSGQENNQNLTDLVAGTYTVTVADTNGCPITETFIISQPDEFLINEVGSSHVDVLCFGENSGEFEVSVVETVGPYDYLLVGTDYLGNTINQSLLTTDLNVIYDELLAGNYDVFVTDQNGCSTELLGVVILQPDEGIDITETISEFNGFNISCFGASDGTIDIFTTGGGGPSNSDQYTYEWTLGVDPFTVVSPSTPTNLQGLGPGIYEVTVTDDVGCTYTETYEITEPDDIVIIVDSEVDILCHGDLTGSISITPQGGSGDYTYYWTYDSDGSGGQQFDDIEDIENLGPGEYVVLVEDSNGCFESEVFQITQPDPIIVTLESKVDILCHGDFTGSIDVSIDGGVPDYNYNWIGPNGFVSIDEDIEALEAGVYNLTIIDQNNCPQVFEVELTQPDDLIINYTATNETCTNANDGSIVLDIQGGVLDYNIAWSNFGNGTTQTNLAPGLYTVTVTDANNCVEEVTIEIEAAPLFDIQPVVNSISCFGENDGNIQLNIQGGVAPINVLWDDDPTAGQDRFNLAPGIYSVTISDSSSFACVIERQFVIVEPAELITSGLVTNALDCDVVDSGSIDLQVVGGTAPYTFEWSNGADSEDLNNIPPGNYAVTVTDLNGCRAIDEFVVIRPDEISAEFSVSYDADCENHTPFQITTIQVFGGVPPYDITWSSGVVSGTDGETMTTSQEGIVIVDIVDALGCDFQTTFEVDLAELGYPDFSFDSFTNNTCNIFSVDDPVQFTNLASGDYISVDWNFGDGFISSLENPEHIYSNPGTYYITQTVNYPYGCSYDIIKEIIITKGYEVILPNAFTPNSDTINDTIRPVFNCMEFVQMSIYDTWGALIYSESSDEDIYGWDGTIDGKPAENGNYILVVKAEAWNGKVIDINGPITLIK